MKSKLQALADALRQELDPDDKSPEGKLLGRRSDAELILVSHPNLLSWDFSVLHKNAGVLSTLYSSGLVNLNGLVVAPVASGLKRRAF